MEMHGKPARHTCSPAPPAPSPGPDRPLLPPARLPTCLVVSQGINSHANFSNFLLSLQTLFRVATGDNWVDVLYGCMLQVLQGVRGGRVY